MVQPGVEPLPIWDAGVTDSGFTYYATTPALFQVTIITSGAVMAEDSSVASLHHQQVALLATANGTHIAVQLEEQQTLEEAISVATAAMQQGTVTLETEVSESGC